MSDAIEGVVYKRPSNDILDGHFRRHRESRERCGQGSRFQVPAQKGGDEVGEAEEVEGAREQGARYAV